MDFTQLKNYFQQEGVSTWRLRNMIITLRSLRVATFDPCGGKLLEKEIYLTKQWAKHAHK